MLIVRKNYKRNQVKPGRKQGSEQTIPVKPDRSLQRPPLQQGNNQGDFPHDVGLSERRRKAGIH